MLQCDETCCSLTHDRHPLQLFNALGALHGYSFQKESVLFKQKKATLSTKTGLVPSIVTRLHSSILIIVHILVRAHFKSMSNNI